MRRDGQIDGRELRMGHAPKEHAMKEAGNVEGLGAVARRRLLAGAAALPLVALGLILVPAIRAHAATASTPASTPVSVRELDSAAMALFDAAEASDWTAARQALARARRAAEAVGSVEPAYTDAGGRLNHFITARNNLGADLIEAKTALSVKDRRWLVSSADHLAARAGELAQPFAEHAGALAPRIDTLLFLARRMRRALVWQDNVGLRAARDDFRRLWQELRSELRNQPSGTRRALDEALTRMTDSASTAHAKALYAAVRQLREGPR